MNIYISRDGRQLGPFSLEEARRQRDAGANSNGDFAWHDGLPDWVPLSQIPGINAPGVSFAPVAPPLPYGAAATGTAPIGARIATALVIFVVLFIALWVLAFVISLMVGGAITGAHAAVAQHAQGYDQGQAVGREAGRQFGKTYGPLIAEWSALFSFVASLLAAWLMAFSNLLPWCRRR